MSAPDDFAARLAARSILKRLRIAQPSDISVEDIAWVEGALIVEQGLVGADARLVHTPGVTPAILRVKKNLGPPGRKRFAIAHELGHLILRHSPGAPTQCAEKEFLNWYKGQTSSEVEANIFASELLMPEALFTRQLARTVPSFDLIEQLATDFQTTLTATAIRYIELCGEKCAVVYSSGGKIAWFRPSPEFHRWISPGKKLSPNTYAADFFETGIVSTKMETSLLDAWVETSSNRDTIKEQSRPLRTYNSVLTLLWLP